MKKSWLKSVPLGIVAILLITCQLNAQRRLELSVKQAVDTALIYRTELKNLRLDRKIQVAQNREITGQAYPQLNGNLAITKFFSIPVTSLPDFISPSVYDVLEKNNVKDGSGNPITAPGSYSVIPARFGVPWTASVGFTFQQLLFQSDVFVGLKARSASLQYADYKIALMEDSIRANVYRSYYSVLIISKRISFLDESVKRIEKLYHDQSEMYKNGFAEQLDLDKTQVTLNNLLSTRNQLNNLLQLGTEALKYVLVVPTNDTLILTDSLSKEKLQSGVLDDGGFRFEDRQEYNALNSFKQLMQFNVKRYKLSYLPTVSAFWSYSQNAQRQKFNFFSRSEKWYETSIVGLSLNIPIFDGFQKASRIQQARFTVEKVNNSLEDLQRGILLQQNSARIQVTNALVGLDIQERNQVLAESVYNKTKIKFENGVGSSFEILQAELSLEESQSNYFQALYDAVIAKIGYTAALGKL